MWRVCVCPGRADTWQCDDPVDGKPASTRFERLGASRLVDQAPGPGGDERLGVAALVVGGGLIGLKTIEALLERGTKVTVVELADRILGTIFDVTGSRIAEQILRREGVDLRGRQTPRRPAPARSPRPWGGSPIAP